VNENQAMANKDLYLNVLLSSGVGRLHFLEIASELKRIGIPFNLVCGYVPRESHKFFLNLIGRFLRRPNLFNRLVLRLGYGGQLAAHLKGNGFAEGAAQFALRLSELGLCSRSWGQRISWQFFGAQTRRYLLGHNIFHVRSGAGGGGAIKRARSLCMFIIFDHIIAHPAYIDAVLAPEYAKFGEIFDGGPGKPFWRLVMEDCCQADIIVVNSDFVKKTFVEQGFDAEKIAIVYWGVRPDFIGLKKRYVCSSKKLRLLFTGALELRKGSRCLIEAMEEMQRLGCDFELHLAGNSADGRRHFGDRLKRLPVIDYGPLLQDQLKQLFIDSDLYVFPTLAEGCARSAMEAMFAGLPVITTEACGLPGNPDEHYCLVPANDPIRLASLIIQLSQDETTRVRLGLGGVQLARSGLYNWQSFGNKLVEVYTALLN
jgi:glycosyltransferase involved in cell wall biosynthesis